MVCHWFRFSNWCSSWVTVYSFPIGLGFSSTFFIINFAYLLPFCSVAVSAFAFYMEADLQVEWQDADGDKDEDALNII